MARLIQIAPAYTGGGVFLPNGKVLRAGQTSVLTNAQWAQISGTSVVSKGTVLDQGASALPPDVGADPATGGGGAATYPVGGATGAVLAKASATDSDVTWKALAKADVGLPSADNTSDANKPASTAQMALFAAFKVVVTPATDARPAVPASSVVIWVGGTTEPINMGANDVWIH